MSQSDGWNYNRSPPLSLAQRRKRLAHHFGLCLSALPRNSLKESARPRIDSDVHTENLYHSPDRQ